MTSDYMRKRQQAKLNPVHSVVHVVTGGLGFTPKTVPGAFADYSGYEWPFDLTKANPPIRIAVGRACYGSQVKDNSIIPLQAQCAATGILPAYYGFLIPNDTQIQIDLFIEQIAKVGGIGQVPAILDIELIREPKPRKAPKSWDYDHPYGQVWQNQCKEWLDQVQAKTGKQPIIYCSQESFWALSVNGQAPAWASDYWFWVSWPPYFPWIDYNKVLPLSKYPAGAKKIFGWQYLFTGRQLGLDPNDLNVLTPEGMAYIGLT